MTIMYTFTRHGDVFSVDYPSTEEYDKLDEERKLWFYFMEQRRGFYETKELAKIAAQQLKPSFVATGRDLITGKLIGHYE